MAQDGEREGFETEADLDGEHDDEALSMNSTMMAIDVKGLKLNRDANTEITVPAPTDEDIIKEKLEQKKSKLLRLIAHFWSKIKSKGRGERGKTELPAFLKPYVDIWICDARENLTHQIIFYATRLAIIGFSLFLHVTLIKQTAQIFGASHPIKNVYALGMVVDTVLVFLVLLFKLSPGWLISLPLSLMSFVMTFGALFFNTADANLVSLHGVSIAQILNIFFILVVLSTAVIYLFTILKNLVARISFALVMILSLFPFVTNLVLKTTLEMSLFGVGFLAKIPWFYAQPVYLVLHVIFPLLSVVFLWFSLKPAQKTVRGFARSLLLLSVFVSALGIALLQKNRVTHAFNFFLPKRLLLGVVEMNLQQSTVKIETENFKRHVGDDTLSRYKMLLKQLPAKSGEFLLTVADEFNFPIKNLTKKDFVISIDGGRVKDFQFKEAGPTEKVGQYTVGLDVGGKAPLITWSDVKKSRSNFDVLEFAIGDLKRVKRFSVQVGEETYIDHTRPTEENYKLPFKFFAPGEHKAVVKAYDDADQVFFEKKFSFTVEIKPELSVLLPLPQDSVGPDLAVFVKFQGMAPTEITAIDYVIDGVNLRRSSGADYFHSFSLENLLEGEHKLTVTANLEKSSLEKTVVFFKKNDLPRFSLASPPLGAYTVRDLRVSYLLDSPERKVAGIKVFVNGFEDTDFSVTDNAFTLPVTKWGEAELHLVVQATLDNGQKLSSWTQINRGLSSLALEFNTETLNFLNYKSVAFILDASISTLDNWQGKEKWDVIKNAVLDAQVAAKVEGLNPVVLVFGAEKSHFNRDCQDVNVLAKPGEYNKTLLRRKLQTLKPNGVSALVSAVKKAYEMGPEKIFLIVDNEDSCAPGVESLRAAMKEHAQTPIVVFVVGETSVASKEHLRQIAELTQGNYYEPQDEDKLKQMLLDEMVLSYELYSEAGDLVSRSPFGERKFQLSPGAYVLKVPFGKQVKDIPIVLENGTKTLLSLRGEKGKLHVSEERTRL